MLLHIAAPTFSSCVRPVQPFSQNSIFSWLGPTIVSKQEVGSETGEHHLTTLNLPRLVTLALNGKIKTTCLTAFATRHLTAVHFVLPINIAVLAPRTDLGASVPRIPVFIDVCTLCHNLVLVIIPSTSNRGHHGKSSAGSCHRRCRYSRL